MNDDERTDPRSHAPRGNALLRDAPRRAQHPSTGFDSLPRHISRELQRGLARCRVRNAERREAVRSHAERGNEG